MNKFFIKYKIIVLITFIILLNTGCNNSEKYIQWAVNNNGERVCGVSGIKNADVSLPDKKSLKLNSSSAIIAVADSFIDFDNINLRGTKEEGVEYSINKANSQHGTAVTGIITTNGLDKNYVSILKNAKIHPIYIQNDNLNIEKLIEDLKCAQKNGVKVVNFSFTMPSFSSELYEFMKSSSMLFVCAVGNNNQNKIEYPASFDLDNIVCVVGINNWGYCSGYSNYSTHADIAAPGENIMCISDNNEYIYQSGTSFAAPYVTAACAYIIDQLDCDGLYAKNILLSCAKCISSLEGKVKDGKLLCLSGIKEKIISQNP